VHGPRQLSRAARAPRTHCDVTNCSSLPPSVRQGGGGVTRRALGPKTAKDGRQRQTPVPWAAARWRRLPDLPLRPYWSPWGSSDRDLRALCPARARAVASPRWANSMRRPTGCWVRPVMLHQSGILHHPRASLVLEAPEAGFGETSGETG